MTSPSCRAFLSILLLTILLGRSLGQDLTAATDAAIERGAWFLLSHQAEDGSFPIGHHGGYPLGQTSLVVYALLKAGVPADDPAVLKAMAFMKQQELVKTYGVATFILAMDASRQPGVYGELIKNAAHSLEEMLRTNKGLWAYPHGAVDLSNTQFAALATWVAEKYGHPTNTALWASLVDGVLACQTDGGGFGYRPNHPATGSMTTAGIAVLLLAQERLGNGDLDGRIAAALRRAWAHMDRVFTATGNPKGANGKIHGGPGAENHRYYLFGVERAATIAGRESIGGRGWYREGCLQLLQHEVDGDFGGIVDTCFALLFLRRAMQQSWQGAETKELDVVGPIWRFRTDAPGEDWLQRDHRASGWKKGAGGFGSFRGQTVVRTPWSTDDLWIRARFRKSDLGDAVYVSHRGTVTIWINGRRVGVLSAERDPQSRYQSLEISPEIAATLTQDGNVITCQAHAEGNRRYLDVRFRAVPGLTVGDIASPGRWLKNPPPDGVGVVRQWLAIGPVVGDLKRLFSEEHVAERVVDPFPGESSGGLLWERLRADGGGILRLNKGARARDARGAHYLYAGAWVSNATDGVLWIGGGPGLRLWIDGKLALSHFGEPTRPDVFCVPVSWSAGAHHLKAKVMNRGDGAQWSCRVVGLDGKPIPSLRWTLEE